ncbi:MAG: agmatine deiminase family protein [Bacteroidota bacterium]|nr:agmatine deiminase family protein [Bacteroidota bacterium]
MNSTYTILSFIPSAFVAIVLLFAGRPEIMRKKDQQAKRIIERAFPGGRVIAINVEVLNAGGGDIHCATKQQPVLK